ncbi:hypothetical protein [Nocardia sp. NPDC004260]
MAGIVALAVPAVDRIRRAARLATGSPAWARPAWKVASLLAAVTG